MADSLYQSGQVVQITNGEFEGRIAKVGQSASVNGAFQYGLEGISETEGHLYAVHEHEITDKIDERPNVVVEEPQPLITSTSTSSHKASFPKDVLASLANPQLEEVDNVSSLLQKASEVAQGRELEFNQTLQGILARLDVLDQRLETKEIKVVVEVHHLWDDRGVDDDISRTVTTTTEQLKAGIIAAATHSDEDRLYDPIEEIVDKARARISNINGNMLQVKDDEDDLQLNMGIFSEEE